jgi:hypothetical protein
MGIMKHVEGWVGTPRNPETLYVSIYEIPQPRDWGTVKVALGKEVLISRDVALVGSSPDELLSWIERNLPKIKVSGYRQVAFENVSEPLQRRIEAILNV